MSVRFLAAGDTAIVVEFGEAVERALSDRVLALSDRVRAAALDGVIETVPTFRSLAVHYDPLATSAQTLVPAIEGMLAEASGSARRRRLWHVPACYEERCAPDLADVAARTGLMTEEVVRLHAGTRFHVYMVGFLPGFPYMGDLPEVLVLPRRTDPRVRVPPGSIAIATTLNGIYPLESPGGWHLIGSTPIRLFDPGWQEPALFSPGDAVRFEPVPWGEHEAIARAVDKGEYRVPCEDVR